MKFSYTLESVGSDIRGGEGLYQVVDGDHRPYDVLQLVDNPGAAKAPLDGFLTTKDDVTYAILTHWTTEPVVFPRPTVNRFGP